MKLLFVCLALLVAVLLNVEAAWPQTSLKCYSSLTQPDNELICPAAKAKYCVKEVSSLTQNLCGKTQYFGDLYTNSQCEFRKCSDHCEAGTEAFTFEGQIYARSTYCCKSDYCNSGTSLKLPSAVLVATVVAMMWHLAF